MNRPYQIKVEYLKGGEFFCAAFPKLEDAKKFMQSKLEYEATLNVIVTYRLYHLGELLEEHSSADVSAKSSEAKAGQASQSKAASFRPTPFNTTPRPRGLPHNWLIDDESKDDKD